MPRERVLGVTREVVSSLAMLRRSFAMRATSVRARACPWLVAPPALRQVASSPWPVVLPRSAMTGRPAGVAVRPEAAWLKGEGPAADRDWPGLGWERYWRGVVAR